MEVAVAVNPTDHRLVLSGEYIKKGSGGWPDGELRDNAPPEAHLVLQASRNPHVVRPVNCNQRASVLATHERTPP